MVSIPTVNSFCGCVDLRVGCIVIASFRLVIYILVILLYLFLYDFNIRGDLETKEIAAEPKKSENGVVDSLGFIQVLVIVFIFAQVVLAIANVLFSYWYIRGITSNQPDKMKYYLIIVAVEVVLLLLTFDLSFFFFALIEVYVYICSNSLYQQICLNSYQQENIENQSENAIINKNDPSKPIPYNGYDNSYANMQDEKPGEYLQ